MNQREIRREAKFRAGLILESVVAAGWTMDPEVIEKYGQEDADRIAEEISAIAAKLVDQS